MNLINYVIILVAFSQSQATSQYLEVPDEFECAKNKAKRSGLCAINVGNNCCEGFMGNECIRELSQFYHLSSPELEFFPNSLVIDNRMSILCVRGLKVKRGESLRDREIRGIYFELDVLQYEVLQPLYSTSTSFIFHGHVTSDALKDSLICVDLHLNPKKLSRATNFISLAMSPLPPSDRREPVAYGSYDRLCDIPRVEILHRHCHEWTEKQVEQVQCSQSAAYSSQTPEQSISTTTSTTIQPLIAIVPVASKNGPETLWLLVAIFAVVLCLAISFFTAGIAYVLWTKKSKSKNRRIQDPESRYGETSILADGDNYDRENFTETEKENEAEEQTLYDIQGAKTAQFVQMLDENTQFTFSNCEQDEKVTFLTMTTQSCPVDGDKISMDGLDYDTVMMKQNKA